MKISHFLLIIFSFFLAGYVIYIGQTVYQPSVIAREVEEKAEDVNKDRLIELKKKQLILYEEMLLNSVDNNKLHELQIEAMQLYLISVGGLLGKLDDRADDFHHVANFNDINLDPFLLWAISIHETGAGHSDVVKKYNNVGGLIGANGFIKSNSIYRGIVEMALQIRYNGHYDNVQGLFSRKTTPKTIEQMGAIYCPVGAANDPTNLNQYWVPSVKKHYNGITKLYNEMKEVEFNADYGSL